MFMSDKNEAQNGAQSQRNQFPPNAPKIQICIKYCAACNGSVKKELNLWCGRWLHGDDCPFDARQIEQFEAEIRNMRKW